MGVGLKLKLSFFRVNMNRWIGNFFDRILEALGGLSDGIDTMWRRPLEDDPDDVAAGGLGRVLWFPWRVLWATVALIFKGLMLPFQMAALMAQGNWRDWALCLPAIGVAALAGFAIVRVNFFGGDIVNRYRSAAASAMQQQDWELAKTYLGRIINSPGQVGDVDRLRWAMVLQRTGGAAQADLVLDALAPEDRPGSPLGHRVKALSLSGSVGQSKRPDTLKRLHWHLKNAGPPKGWELNQAWASYYLTLGEIEKAIGYLEAAAEFKPELWLQAAEIYRQRGDLKSEQRAVQQAVSIFETRAARDPSDSRSRVAWANALFRSGDADRAEEVLLQGLKISGDRLTRHAMADFYLMRHDQAVVDDPDNFGQQFELLKRAIELDVNYYKTYQRLIERFTAGGSDGERDRICGLLEGMITEGKVTALGHFALANMLWLSGDLDEAQWHMEQAYELDNRLVLVANNLAWFLAHRDDPDLDRALTLAQDAVDRSDDPRFRDTLATVLMKQEKYDLALVELKKTLERIKNKSPVHEKLALVYERLGKPRLAALHREKVGDGER